MGDCAAPDSTPLLSIGLPVYNGARFLAEAIESLLAQDVADLELIISDNGSTDCTEQICRDAVQRDPRVRYYRSPTNRGAAWNYNTTFGLARGTYFRWAAHDDLCDRRHASACIDVLERRRDVSLAFTDVIEIDREGATIRRRSALASGDDPRLSWRVSAVLHGLTECFEVFGVARRAQLARTGLIRPSTGSDRVLMLELAMQGTLARVAEDLFFHRQHPNRSMARYADARARTAWFDPSRRRLAQAPRWRMLGQYSWVVCAGGGTVAERVIAVGPLLRWIARNGRRLGWELGGFTIRLVRELISRRSPTDSVEESSAGIRGAKARCDAAARRR